MVDLLRSQLLSSTALSEGVGSGAVPAEFAETLLNDGWATRLGGLEDAGWVSGIGDLTLEGEFAEGTTAASIPVEGIVVE